MKEELSRLRKDGDISLTTSCFNRVGDFIQALLDCVEAMEAARIFIEKEHADPAAQVYGEWLSAKARPIHGQICDAIGRLYEAMKERG